MHKYMKNKLTETIGSVHVHVYACLLHVHDLDENIFRTQLSFKT